jgi:glucose/arabinose dehydrogenase
MRIRPLKFAAWSIGSLLALLLVLASVMLLITPNLEITSWRMMLNAITGAAGPQASQQSVNARLRVAEGFHVSLYAADVPKARFLRASATGDLLVSQPRLGQILLLERDANGDGAPDGRRVLLSGLDRPHGIEISEGWLYVGESSAVGRVAFDSDTGSISGDYARILEGLPEGGNHWSRTVRAGPDGWLYVSIGSSCNVCEEQHPWRAAMLRLRGDGSDVQLHATGLRNSVGFDWAPWSDELFATDNGRDLLGDDFPPCELNRIEAGAFYGWPYINGDGVLDPDLGAGREELLKTARSPAHGFRAHTAPLGISFLRDAALPAEYRRSALVALHGSWNRSTPDGYKVVRLHWDDQDNIQESDFLSGFEQDGDIIGRPVDIVEAADGSIFISDDYAGAIYRVRSGQAAPGTAASADASDELTAGIEVHDPLAHLDAATLAAARAEGARLWKRFACAGCHAPGSIPGERLKTLHQRYDVAQLSDFFVTPTPPMPLFPLAEQQRRDLAIHLLALSSSGEAP